MAGVTFHHPNVPGDLIIRLAPTEVNWTYNINSTTTDTYGGQVVQILSINFDKFIIQGQLGFEGPWGSTRKDGKITRRTSSDWRTSNPLGVGLAQMTSWFRQYFSVASQGTTTAGEDTSDTNYSEEPVTVVYEGNIGDIPVDANKRDFIWRVYPVAFPSWRRTQENFSPEWRVECEVAEAPSDITAHESDKVINRIQFGDRYSPMNPFSDPAGWFFQGTKQGKREILEQEALKNARQDSEDIFDYYSEFIGNLATKDLTDLIEATASMPVNAVPKSFKAGQQRGKDRIKESRSRRHLTDDTLRSFIELN